jgi:NAD(P)H dehydrogenase (quinone)
MTASVYLAHPYEKSFNHAIFNRVNLVLDRLNVETYTHDLYAEEFNPSLTVRELGFDVSEDPQVLKYADELMASDLLIFVHPNWWGQPPAILKGWIDRVIRPPYAYDYPPELPAGAPPVQTMTGKRGLVFNTSNTPEEREDGYFGDPLENIWRQCIFGFCGIEMFKRRMFRIVADSDDATRISWLDEVERIIESAISAGNSTLTPDCRSD